MTTSLLEVTKNIKMKKFKNIIFFLFAIGLTVSCQDDDYKLGKVTVPSNLVIDFEVVGQSADMPYGDGSGTVNFTASADDAMTYKYVFGDGFTLVSPSGTASHSFNKNGVNDYTVQVIATGAGGVPSNKMTTVTVFSDFSDPETAQLLSGGDSKTWYVAASQPGHLGVGPSSGDGFSSPIYYAAPPFDKAGESTSCFYTDELTFSLNGEDLVYDYNNNGATFFNASYAADFGGSGGDDACLAFDGSGTKNVSLSPSTSGLPADQTSGTVINIADGGFMSYYIGASSYEILSITETTLYVRAIMGNDPGLAWYLKFTTTPGDAPAEEEFESQFQDLSWSDEFDGDALDTNNWNYDIGNGDNGWGNGEAQYYTDSEENVKVADGNLIITAKRESTNGFNFTSARITTNNKQEFTYGRVSVRAKLTSGGGTWPAIWMLGADFPEQSWPGVGEMDIMEYVGNTPGRVSSALHFPGNSGGNAIVGDVAGVNDATSEFHIYEVEWTADKITFLLDGVPHLEFDNDTSTPFQDDFYLLLNVAMGGSLGGAIDPAFQESSMEIDYVRIYK